ncbi:MAG: sulfate permease [Labilithrix sp.]|nr:sulfate permease [Labilithrix sp.]MCW5812562.1 sulfate permease [Labilithrix sp.]
MSGKDGRVIPPLPEKGVRSWFPGLWTARHYQRSWLVRDVGAGLALTTLLVPAGMGYAEAAGLPAVAGLYATVLPLLVYALVGPSRILVLGPDSALTALIAVVVVAKAPHDPARAVAFAAVLALMTGGLCVAAGLLGLGFVTELLSKPVRVGYMNGIGLTIVITQLPKLLGFSVDAADVLDGAPELLHGVAAGRVDAVSLLIGGGCLAVIFVARAVAPRAPGVLVAVIGATLAVKVFDLHERLAVVGVVPRGLPVPALPRVALGELPELVVTAIGIALVSFADTSVVSRTFAGRNGYRVEANRELVALGLANVGAGLFGGFPISSSASRTPVAEAAGARTQLTGVVGAVAIVVLLVLAPALLADLPRTALAAVVISAAVNMFDAGTLRRAWKVRRSDFLLALVAFAAVASLGVVKGIAVAVATSLLDVVRRVWRPHDAILGRAPGVKGYHDVKRYPNARQVPGLVILRWDAPLFFANADLFRARVLEAAQAAAAATPTRWVVVAAEPITDVDTTAAEMLEELDVELGKLDAELAFAELKDPVKDRLQRYGLEKRIGREFFFPTIGVAVKEYLARHPVEWTDWEDA